MKLVLLGVGKLALSVARLAHESGVVQSVYGTTRSAKRFAELRDSGIEPLHFYQLFGGGPGGLAREFSAQQVAEFHELFEDACLLISFPPSGDFSYPAAFAQLCRNRARSVVYISSTSVYGSQTGLIADNTDVCADTPLAAARLRAECFFREAGAIVLRAPALYGFDRGLHLRLLSGSYVLPPLADNIVSRIHQDDLGAIILSAFNKLAAGECYLVGDKLPARHRDVFLWLCERLKLDPAGFAGKNAGGTIRADRSVDGATILKRLEYELRYPDYKMGYEAILSRLGR